MSKKPSIATQIVTLLYEHGPMICKAMMGTIVGFEYKSVYQKCLDLEKMGLVQSSGKRGEPDQTWSLRPGVTPATLETGEIASVVTGEGEDTETPDVPAAVTRPPAGIALDQRGQFIQHMIAIGVTPKDAVPTIADIFMSGDIDSLKWLDHVLGREAAGYVNPHHRRLMLSWWANTRGLPYDPEEFAFEDVKGKGAAKGEGKAEGPAHPLDAGLGWQVGKDKAGDWVPVPGGPLTYDEALSAAERRALIASYGTAGTEGEPEAPAEGEPIRRGGARPRESPTDYMMKKIVDNFIEEGKGGGRGGQSDEVKRLTDKIDQMERDRQDDRVSRLEGLIAELAGRDPWEEYDRMQSWRQRMGLDRPVVTDQSPAVQILTDTAEKFDRNMNRFVGIVERTVLHSEDFTPEATRTKEEQEAKAGKLLTEASTRDKSKQLRRAAFGR